MSTNPITLLRYFLTFIAYLSFTLLRAKDIDMVKYGAKPDGRSDNTAIIQKAIDECTSSGGGIITFPAGTYLAGSLFVKDNVTLYLRRNAILQGIAKEAAFAGEHFLAKGFIRIEKARNVSIIGEGTIDGNGRHKVWQKGNNAKDRPYLVHVKDSRNIVIKDVTLQNSAFWTLRLFRNVRVRVDGVTIYGHANWNNDGIDLDSKDVIVSNCLIDTDDDAICFKSDSKEAIVENVTITNCIVASNCNFIKFGTAGFGGFKNIAVSNCTLRPASESNFQFWNKHIPSVKDSISGIAGIALEMVSGGYMDQITISNITMEGVQTPIFIRLGSRNNPTGSLKNVVISNIVANACSAIPSIIAGVPGFQVENVSIRDVLIKSVGGGTQEDIARDVPENEKGYPENRMFGLTLPAYGFYVRHAKNIFLDNIQFQLKAPDARPALWFDDAQEVTVNYLRATPPTGNGKLMVQTKSTVKITERQAN